MRVTIHKKINNLIIIFSVLILGGCYSCKENKREVITDGTFLYSEEIRHAEGFSIDYYKEFTKVTINNPWSNDQKPYAEYYIYKSGETKNRIIEKGKFAFSAPLSSLIVNTFSYFEFLILLDKLETVTGVTDGFRIYNPTILGKIERGIIKDLGDPFNPNIEKSIELNPDAVINSAYAQTDNYSEKILKSGIPVIYSLEWMENTPLARTEWIKMIAAFFGKGDIANTIFNDIEKKYFAVKKKVEGIDDNKSVLAGDNFQGTWYLPGGESFNAALFKDAGLSYLFENNKQSGSIGLDIESVLTQFGNSDIWFGCEANSYNQLLSRDSKYKLLSPVKNRIVFNYHNRITALGGNDYFESAIANPDLILSDIVEAAYPNLLPNYSYCYIKPLN
jgi:iron complex transport system substrate-binding protein